MEVILKTAELEIELEDLKEIYKIAVLSNTYDYFFNFDGIAKPYISLEKILEMNPNKIILEEDYRYLESSTREVYVAFFMENEVESIVHKIIINNVPKGRALVDMWLLYNSIDFKNIDLSDVDIHFIKK